VALSFPCAPFSMQVGSLGANSRHPHPAEIKTLLLLLFRYIFRFPFVACGRVIMRGGFDDICVVVTAKTRDSRQLLPLQARQLRVGVLRTAKQLLLRHF